MHRPRQVKPTVVFVLGGPGSGKGTQCSYAAKDCVDFEHVSAGELLRLEALSDSPRGEMISKLLKEGGIVPSRITVTLLERAIQNNKKSFFLIDGFPRNRENNVFWESVMSQKVDVPLVLYYDCPTSVMENRLLQRGESSNRTDDNISSIKKRFLTFETETLPVVGDYERRGKLVRINADRPPDVVYQDTRAALARLTNSAGARV